MTEGKRRIDISDLPRATATELNAGDLHDTPETIANVKGGSNVDKGGSIREIHNIKGISSSSGDPGI